MYCTSEDVRGELYIPLSTQMAAKFSGPGEFDEFLERHIAAASDYVDAVLARTFDVPLSLPAPSAVRTATAKEAAFYAVAQFSEHEDLLRDRHDTAVAMLNALVEAGRLPGTEVPTQRVIGGSNDQIFTASVLDEW
jgi:phage gp36-like protein